MTNIEFQVPSVYKVMLFGLKLNIIATIFLVVEEGLQTFWLSSHLRCPLNLLEIFSRKLFWGAMRPFLAAARCITDITDITLTRPTRGYDTTPPSCTEPQNNKPATAFILCNKNRIHQEKYKFNQWKWKTTHTLGLFLNKVDKVLYWISCRR